MRKYNISANLVRTIEQLYDKATSAVQMNCTIGEWFRTTVGVRQGCLLSPTLFSSFLERVMSDALEEHDGKASIGGRNITNLRFADDIDALAEEEQELEALVESLDKTCTRYKMEISAEKTKLMTNSANGIQREIKVNGQKLGTVTSFKYLGAVVSDDGSKPEVLSRIAQATAALTKLKPIWRDNKISLGSKVKLMCSLVISIFLYACESWTLTAELRVNHSNVAFSSWSMLYQHTRHRKSNKFKTLCQKLASVFGLPVAQTRNCRPNYQIFFSSRKTLKMTFFRRYVLHFKNYLFSMKIYCTMPYKNLKFWHLITQKIIFQKFWYIHFGFALNIAQDIAKGVEVVLRYTFELFTIQALVILMKII